MTSTTVPGPASGLDRLETASSLCELFQHTAAARGDAPALRSADGRTTVSWEQYAARVQSLAAGLAGIGVRRGDAVALMMGNRPEFHLLDTAALHLGATAFSIYTTFAPETIAHLLGNAGAKVVVCAGEHPETILAARERTAVEQVVTLEGDDARTMTLDELEAEASADFDFDASWRAVGGEDVRRSSTHRARPGPPRGWS